jgi:hypothetical protein
MEENTKEEAKKVESVNKVDATKDSKREYKSGIDKSAKIILEFLRGCTQFECDAIRVMVNTSEDNANLASINKEDLLAVNRYLNYGYYKEDGDSFDKVLAHRQVRAQKLMKTVGAFVGKDEIIQVSSLLMMITSNPETMSTTCKNLPNRPDDGKAMQNKSSIPNGSTINATNK